MTIEKKEIDYKSYKWLLSSALQKSLRRGNYELAKSYVDFLWEHDRSYLTYRLGTIITEDVGITNIPLLKKYLDTQLRKEEINNMGGLDFIQEIVKESCESLKDRSSCDAAYFASYFSFSNEINETLNSFKKESDKISYLREIIKNKECSYVDRINAGWVILGNHTFKNEILPFFSSYLVTEKGKNIDNLENFIESFELTDDFVNVMKNAHLTQKEQIVLGLPIVQYLFNEDMISNEDNKNIKLNVGDTVEKVYFTEETYEQPHIHLSILNSSIDGHTREGKIVYSKYLNMKNEFTDYMNRLGVNYNLRSIVLSHCLFRLEGHEVNKRVYFPSAVRMMMDCTQKVLNMKLGFNANAIPEEFNIPSFKEIRPMLLNDMSTINSLREKAIHNMSIQYVEPKKTASKKLK